MLKTRFRVFSLAKKKVEGFSSDRKIFISLLSVLFHLQNRFSQFFKILTFSQDIWENVHCPWNQPDFLRNSDKSPLSLKQNKLKEIRDTVFNAKINVSPNMPCSFLLFKVSGFLHICFPRNLLFRQVLRTSVFLNSKCLTFLYQFISLLKNTH